MNNPGKPRKIIEPATGRVWKSIAALSEETGMSFAAIKRHASAGTRAPNGHLYVFDREPTAQVEPTEALVRKLRLDNSRLRAENVLLRRRLRQC